MLQERGERASSLESLGAGPRLVTGFVFPLCEKSLGTGWKHVAKEGCRMGQVWSTPHPAQGSRSCEQSTELGSVGLLWHLLPQPEPHLRLGPVNVL